MGCFNATCGISNLPISYNDHVYGTILDATEYFAIDTDVILRPDDMYSISSFEQGQYDDYGGIVNSSNQTILSDREDNGDYTKIWMCHKHIYDSFLTYELNHAKLVDGEIQYETKTIEETADDFIYSLLHDDDFIYFRENFKANVFFPIRQFLTLKENNIMRKRHRPKEYVAMPNEPPSNYLLELYKKDFILRKIMSMLGKPLFPIGSIHSQGLNFRPFQHLNNIVGLHILEKESEE